MAQSLTSLLEGSLYEQYLYSYPHKLAYGPITPQRTLAEVWQREPKQALFLYAHIPYCEQRCGFCNLFTFANPNEDQPARYLDALRRQMTGTRAALGADATFARYAIGGGTPTYLSEDGLRRMFDDLAEVMGLDSKQASGSVETSPLTATEGRLRVLHERGVERVSMGVQSFIDDESASVGRRQSAHDVHEAVRRIRSFGFPTLNLDLMYGLPGQTTESFFASIQAALEHRPEELYLYPLYVRPLTLLGRSPAGAGADPGWDEARLSLYRAARDRLFSEGYAQVSMRMFRRKDVPSVDETADYRCERDGMVGLGAGARSYTSDVHYSTAYAVGTQKVRSILDGYLRLAPEEMDRVSWGYVLSDAEKRRRFVILSLLHESGLDDAAYRERFGSAPADDVPELVELLAMREPEPLVEHAGGRLVLTPAGMERSDQIGPNLMSAAVRERVTRGPA
ncbi:MAG: STM4012 family radical SAM protein, partial [Polyangiaceae bacterium]|nr:STM4012 family radical SAM protein [Polyangiaceae bacterium]